MKTITQSHRFEPCRKGAHQACTRVYLGGKDQETGAELRHVCSCSCHYQADMFRAAESVQRCLFK